MFEAESEAACLWIVFGLGVEHLLRKAGGGKAVAGRAELGLTSDVSLRGSPERMKSKEEEFRKPTS